MNKQLNIGIIGLGYVGSAIRFSYEDKNALNRVHTFDINPATNPTCESISDVTNIADIIYVCVPTPMNNTGVCDLTIVEQVVQEICASTSKKTIVLKSTVTPGTTERLQTQYPQHDIFFCPEFLTEKNYLDDYLNQDLMVIGVPKNIDYNLTNCILQNEQTSVCTVRHVSVMDATAAELYKYVANNFLATKVSFANEMEGIARELDVNWNDIVSTIIHDPRMGRTHWKVPGPDGHRGFGGTCFPKDINATITFANSLGVGVPLLKAVWNRNVYVDRPEKDWEQLKGRAVT